MHEKFEVIKGSPEKDYTIYVDWDKCKRGKKNDVLYTTGYAPCLAVTLYDPITKKGSMAHIYNNFADDTKIKPDDVVDKLLRKIRIKDPSAYQRLEASISGESDVEEGGGISGIIKDNLENLGIPLIGEDLGDVPSWRCGYLFCDTGKVEVYHLDALNLGVLLRFTI